MTGVVYNLKHERANDSLLKAQEEGRLEEFLQVAKNNQEYQSKVISLGLEIPIEQVDETITHPLVRTRLANAIKGGAVPRLSTDEPTDIDIFPKQVEGQTSGETAQTDEAHNISKLCEKYPGKYPAPSEFYFGDIDAIFSASKDAEIDLTVMRVENEVAQRILIKSRKNVGSRNHSKEHSIRVRWSADLTMRMRGRTKPV